MAISLIIISRKRIPLPGWVNQCQAINEILIIDDQQFPVDGDFAAKRNYGLKIARNNWCLFLDTDEEPSTQLIEFLNHFNYQQNIAFRRLDLFLGRRLKFGETGHFYSIRLVNRRSGQFVGRVHEIFQTTNYRRVNIPIYHRPHSSFYSFIEKINFYSDLRAKELFDQKRKTNLFWIIFYPLAKFIQNYFLKLGFLDGIVGLIHALGMSFYSFLVRSKLWSMSRP
ncbi:MAG TPA: hypothetical protein PK131_01630 [Candidatus Woesebacteria bacterium]|nr:hypothetical protein [Candidatus Woesebacteria bacterium]HRS23036.1 hypothetical protein [Candidatus Woesebacteria bacterium]HRT40129.1 hypothetical protein [Candidatus Woesebacteria bacterium]